MHSGAARVTVIPAYARASTSGPVELATKKRVAAYARVSTDNEEQLTSYEAQVDYYTRHIKERDEWTFVEVYTDEGISATSTKHRDGFKRMICVEQEDRPHPHKIGQPVCQKCRGHPHHRSAAQGKGR